MSADINQRKKYIKPNIGNKTPEEKVRITKEKSQIIIQVANSCHLCEGKIIHTRIFSNGGYIDTTPDLKLRPTEKIKKAVDNLIMFGFSVLESSQGHIIEGEKELDIKPYPWIRINYPNYPSGSEKEINGFNKINLKQQQKMLGLLE